MVATNEIDASIRTAEQHMRSARITFREGLYATCSYHSASAAENASNALILALGGKIPRVHRNAEALELIVKRLRPKWLKNEGFRDALAKLRELERHVIKPRYPIRMENGTFLTPDEYYNESIAKDMLENATFVVNTVKKLLSEVKRKR